MDFAVSADQKVNLKEGEKNDQHLDFARELKKLWNMKVTFMPIVIGALGTVTKRLVKWPEDLEIRGRVEIIQNAVLLRLARIMRKFLETRRLVVTQTPVKDPHLTLMWKTLYG